MSFFVSDSLKGLISEKDLEAESPIKIIKEKENLAIRFNTENNIFKCDLSAINFSEKLDKIKIITNTAVLENIVKSNKRSVTYSILANDLELMQTLGILYLSELEVNKEDNCIICKIDIFKRGSLNV